MTGHTRIAIMWNRNLLIATSLALLTGIATASPDEYEREEYYERPGPMPFEALDLDGDGVVTAQEHAQVRAQRHAAMAKRGYPMRNAAGAPRFEQIDSDGDESISRDELSAHQLQRMQRKGMHHGRYWGD
jgi:hypothetical protein